PVCAGTRHPSDPHMGYGADRHGPRYRHGTPVGCLANADSAAPQSAGSAAPARPLQWASDTALAQYAGRTGSRARRLWSVMPAGGGRRVGLWVPRLSGARAGGLLSHPAGISGHDPCRAADLDALAWS